MSVPFKYLHSPFRKLLDTNLLLFLLSNIYYLLCNNECNVTSDWLKMWRSIDHLQPVHVSPPVDNSSSAFWSCQATNELMARSKLFSEVATLFLTFYAPYPHSLTFPVQLNYPTTLPPPNLSYPPPKPHLTLAHPPPKHHLTLPHPHLNPI